MKEFIHGKYSLELQENILVLTLSGEFNEYGVQAYANEVKELVATLAGKPFLVLVDNSALKGATPEAYQASERYNQWLSQQNLLAKATVYPNNMLTHIDKERVPSKQRIQYKTFTQLPEARAWLSSFLT